MYGSKYEIKYNGKCVYVVFLQLCDDVSSGWIVIELH